MSNFIRQIEVLIGPVLEGKGGNTAQAMRLFSDGSRDGLRISFHIQKSNISIPNYSVITFYNLNENTSAVLNDARKQIIINAGWQSADKLPLLFSGGILYAYSERQGADIVTKVMAMTMGDLLSQTVKSFAFKSGMYVSDCLLSILAAMPDIKIDKSAIQQLSKNKVSKGGIAHAGPAKDILDMLGRQYGFNWSIQDGIFQVVGDNTAIVGTATLLDGNEGSLISLTPLLVGPWQQIRGVRIKTPLQHNIQIDKTVIVKNSANKFLDNTYIVNVADYSGDTFSNEWFVDIQALFET